MQHLRWLLPYSIYPKLLLKVDLRMISHGITWNYVRNERYQAYLRYTESEFSNLWIPQVVHMRIKEWETFSSYIPFVTFLLTLKNICPLVALILCPEHIEHVLLFWYLLHNDWRKRHFVFAIVQYSGSCILCPLE